MLVESVALRRERSAVGGAPSEGLKGDAEAIQRAGFRGQEAFKAAAKLRDVLGRTS
jgi:hypothetical protein